MAEGDDSKKENGQPSQPPKPSSPQPKVSSPESRLRKSTLSSPTTEKQQTSPQKQSSGDPKLAQVYKAPPKPDESSEKTPKEKKSDEESSSDHVPASSAPRITFISISSKTRSTQQATPTSRSPGRAITDADNGWFGVTVETVIANSKTETFQVKKATTVATLKSLIRKKLKVRNFVIYYNHRELGPEDSTLESNGITESCKVRLHIRAQTGTSDKEDINAIVRLSKSLADLKSVLGSSYSTSTSVKPKPRVRAASSVGDHKKKVAEDEKTRGKMAQLREKLAQRSGKKDETKKKIKKRKSRRDGGIAGQFPLPPEVTAPPSSTDTGSAEEASDREKIKSPVKSAVSTGSCVSVFETAVDCGIGPVTAKELMLYFDPPESLERARFYTNELFEPPTDYENLEKIRHEFKTLRCALCHTRLPIALREMPCRCTKVYCQPHRNPFKHHCPVDLKKVDRTKLEKEVPKAASVTQRKDGSEEEPAPKSSTKKLM